MKSIDYLIISSLFAILGLSFVFLLPGNIYSREAVGKDLRESSESALADYIRHMVNKENFATFGFKSIRGARSARLEKPYRVMFIGLKDLQEYMPGTGAKSLMKDAKTLWFPVVVSGETQTKLEMVEKKGKWIPGEFGGLGPVQKVVANQKQLPELLEPIKTGAPYTLKLLKIPELYAVFLYVEGLQKEYLIPAMVQPQRFQLKNGKLYTADEVLSKLSEYAKKIAPDKVI